MVRGGEAIRWHKTTRNNAINSKEYLFVMVGILSGHKSSYIYQKRFASKKG
jgi:hypothetical protein